LFDSLIDRSISPYGIIDFRYTLVTEEAVVAGSQMMARWVMTTTNAVQLGARMEVSKQGMLSCKFNSAHKIVGLEFMFDVMAFMLQLKQAAGSDGFTVIPNTVQTCQRSFDKPMVMTQSEPPYTIIQVNSLWEEMTGYSSNEVVGRLSCSVLQGANMDRVSLMKMMDEVRHKRPASALLVNRRKTGDNFTNYLVIYPLSTDSRVAYFLGLSIFWSACTPSNTVKTSSSQGIVTSSHPQPFHATPVLSSAQYSNAGAVSNTCPPNILSQVPASEQSLCLHLGQSTSPSSSSNKVSQAKRIREEDSDCRL
jgi:PAS domain S-box-containing protein